jgi:hypothetical protein
MAPLPNFEACKYSIFMRTSDRFAGTLQWQNAAATHT